MNASRPHFANSLWMPLVILCGVALLASLLVPNYARARSRGASSACRSNLTSLGRAIDAHANENSLYPPTLHALIPRNLGAIPTCPLADADTYSAGYTVNLHCPAAYTVVCTGDKHSGPSNYPQYTSYEGLIWR